jgi:hypothetical protein
MSKVDRETAQQDFDRFVRFARLKLDRVRNENDRRDIESDTQYFIEEIMDGRISVDDEGHVIVYTESENENLKEIHITTRPKVSILRAMDKAHRDQGNAKWIAAIGEHVGIAPSVINKLDMVDWQNLEMVCGFFLANRI